MNKKNFMSYDDSMKYKIFLYKKTKVIQKQMNPQFIFLENVIISTARLRPPAIMFAMEYILPFPWYEDPRWR